MSLMNSGKASVLVLMSLIYSTCSALAGSPPTVQQLAIDTGAVADWPPDTSMRTFIGDQLYDLIDGGAPKYLDNGCLLTGIQRFSGLEGTQAESRVMDFGKDSIATAMFKEMQVDNIGQTITDPDFPDSTVFFVLQMGGVTGYAHFNNIYIEISLTGFSEMQESISALNLFLGYYYNKIRIIRNVGIRHVSSANIHAKSSNPYRRVFVLEGRHSKPHSSYSGIYNIQGQQMGSIQRAQIIIVQDR